MTQRGYQWLSAYFYDRRSDGDGESNHRGEGDSGDTEMVLVGQGNSRDNGDNAEKYGCQIELCRELFGECDYGLRDEGDESRG